LLTKREFNIIEVPERALKMEEEREHAQLYKKSGIW